MRVLVIEEESQALDFSMRCLENGHQVVWFDRNRENGSVRQAGKGIVPKLIDYDLLRTKYIDWADLIFLPYNGRYLEMLEPYRQRGYPIFGSSVEAAKWEMDRATGQEVMKKAGMKTLASKEFHDYDDAARFVEKNPTYLVSKPSGDAEKQLSYVADSPADLVHMLTDRWKKKEKYVSDARTHGFILQEKMRGVEMAVGGIFGPSGWVDCWYENFEFKKLMNGDLGPNTGEMGTLSMWTNKSKLADIALKPLTKQLKAIEYVGFIDTSGMIDEKGEFWPFEFTMRAFWPGFHNIMATLNGDPAQQMLDCLMGRNTWQIQEGVTCVSVVIAIPDFPYSHLTAKEVHGIPIHLNGDRKQVHLIEVQLSEDVPCMVQDKVIRLPCYTTAGDYVCVVTGCGETITGARRSAYTAAKKVKMPGNPFYRTDIGSGRMISGLPELQKHGFATGFRTM